MLLRYNFEGHPHIDEVQRCFYNPSLSEATFVGDKMSITAHGVDSARWNIFVNDMFVDGKLSIPEEFMIDIE